MIEQKDGIQIIEIYGDESGSISKNRKFPFFSICFLLTENVFCVKNNFKKWKKVIRKKYNWGESVEVKGAMLSDDDLLCFVEKFMPHLKVYCAPLDCSATSEKMLSNSKITYNFIVNKLMQRIVSTENWENKLIIKLELDQINNSVAGMNSLEDYLNISFINEQSILKIAVNYYDSHLNWKVQLADIMSHYFYRASKHNWVIDNRINIRKIY